MTALSHPPSVPYIATEREMLEAFLDAMRLGDLTEEFSAEGGIEAVVEFYNAQCERSRELVSTLPSLDETATSERFGNEVSLR